MLCILFQDEQQQKQNVCGLLALWNATIAVTTTNGQLIQAAQILDAIGSLLIQASGDLQQSQSTLDGAATGATSLGGGIAWPYPTLADRHWSAPKWELPKPLPIEPQPVAKVILAASGSLIQVPQAISAQADMLDIELLMLMLDELTAA